MGLIRDYIIWRIFFSWIYENLITCYYGIVTTTHRKYDIYINAKRKCNLNVSWFFLFQEIWNSQSENLYALSSEEVVIAFFRLAEKNIYVYGKHSK